jgi:hypothetical protein
MHVDVVRAADALPDGRTILEFLCRADITQLMCEAADADEVVVSRLSGPLLAALPHINFHDHSVRRFIGVVTRAVLAEQGYEVRLRGTRVSGDPIFASGSRYARVQGAPLDVRPTANVSAAPVRYKAGSVADQPLLTRMLSTLTDAELREVIKIAQSELSRRRASS